jgi:hypothetical protein
MSRERVEWITAIVALAMAALFGAVLLARLA